MTITELYNLRHLLEKVRFETWSVDEVDEQIKIINRDIKIKELGQ